MADGPKKSPSKPKKEKETKVSAKLSKIIQEIEELSVLELNDLIKALEKKFGVSAIPALSVAPAAPAEASAEAKEAAPAQTTFNVIIAESGANKIQVIKTLREINQNLGLKEAKDLVDAAPKEILTGVNKETAENAKKKLEAVGAKIELK